MKKIILLSLLSLSAFACGSSGSGTPANGADGGGGDGGSCSVASTGSIVVNVTGLPAGVDGSVTITGPGGAQSVTATKTIAGAKSGDYTVTAANVGQADPIVRKAYKAAVAVASAKLCDGQSVTVDVSYTLIPTSNAIWWGSSNSASDTLGYASASLAATGSPVATIAATTAGAIPGAFDKNGNLWVLDGTAGAVGLKRYTAASLATGGTKTPDIVVSSDALTGGVPGPASIAFDMKGNLWIGVIYSQKVVEFDATQIAATGTVTPKVEISNVSGANALAFDVKGNLWVGATDNVVEYVIDRLGASTSAAPDVTITAMSPQPVVAPLTNVLGLAFTADDKLWVNYDGTIARIDNLGNGAVTPAIQIKADVLSLPAGIALDEGGGLWMAYAAGKFCKFGASQLGASGSVAPEVIVTSSSVGSATSPVLFPAPATLPMYSALN